jgi:hypothetical protein
MKCWRMGMRGLLCSSGMVETKFFLIFRSGMYRTFASEGVFVGELRSNVINIEQFKHSFKW